MDTKIPTTIDEYIAACPKEVQSLLKQIRAAVHAAAPQAVEKISYGMPTFYLNGNLVHFAAHKHHIGFYPAPRALEIFKDELANYKGSKGAVQFPFDQPLPLDLVARITRYRVEENMKKAKKK
jgi:uncharacterized protein YdhG (YjbR/CyaY superfamily)